QIQEDPWAHASNKYPPGTRVQGKVVSLTDYGAFIEMEPGVEGLVHISEMSWTKRVKHPSKVMAIGDQVNAVVLDVDAKAKRISLGIKQLHPDPWTELPNKYPIGSRVKGKVTKVADFGAFVEIEPGIEGLVHVSELRDERVENPRDVVKEGDELDVKVIDMDPHERKVALSVKAALNEGEDYREYMRTQGSGRASLGEVFGEKLGGRKGRDR